MNRPLGWLLVGLSAGGIAAGSSAAPPESDPAVRQRLIAALRDPDPEVRQNVAIAVSRLGPDAVEPLAAALKDSLPERRAGAAYALALLGPASRPALPALLDALDDKDTDVRRQVSYALGRILSAPRMVPGAPASDRAPPAYLRGNLR